MFVRRGFTDESVQIQSFKLTITKQFQMSILHLNKITTPDQKLQSTKFGHLHLITLAIMANLKLN